jgi:DNA-binding response OmpR family regulator
MLAETILILEDNPDIREVLSLLLQAEGFNVCTAEDCASGFEKLLKQPPDLVITDVMLPDYSGLQFIRWVRERAARDKTPVIAMTAFEPGYLTAATHLGADAVIHKPEELDRLTETIKAVLSLRSRQPEPIPTEERETPPLGGYAD